MPQFIIKPINIKNNQIILTTKDADFHHIFHVLRFKVGDKINFLSLENISYTTRVTSLTATESVLKILQEQILQKKDKFTLFQALPKNKKMDFIIEKAVELGVDEIVPLISQNVIIKTIKTTKLNRWQEIAIAATKQSGNPLIPKIHPPQSFSDAIKNINQKSINLIGYENSKNALPSDLKQPLPKNDKNIAINLIIGSEGGFTQTEIDNAKIMGWQNFRLKGNILRAETAPIVLISIIKYKLDLL
ncbi:MAG: 16S rRNA (uracil(1498)-N(3))-methyltransferase [bacterium]|nr:16S rRNA (uracil(1498)-N(3))-methyltransferase [bacterium]